MTNLATRMKRAAAGASSRWPNAFLGLGTVLLLVACLLVLGMPAYGRLQARVREAAVQGNAATLQLAAETYAAVHEGLYPEDPVDLLPYLPGDSAPRNPYTGQESLFQGGAGDLTYRSPSRGRDYVIQAWACDDTGEARLVMTLRGRSSRARR